MGLLDLTSCRAWSTKHRKGPLDSTSTRPALLNIDPSSLFSTLAQTLSTRYRPKPTGLHISRAQTTQHCSGPLGLTSSQARHDIDPGPDDSTLDGARSTRPRAGPGRLEANIQPSWPRSMSNRVGSGPCQVEALGLISSRASPYYQDD